MDPAAPDLPGYQLLTPVFEPAGDAAATGAAESRPRVWRGIRLADRSPVAIKVFGSGLAELAGREAAIGREIDHRHVLAAGDVVGSGDVVALVFVWADGGSLARLLRYRRRLPWAETLTVLIPLADAVAAAHERGYVHGDISADNVLFDAAGRPMLADFGAARAAQESGVPVAVTAADVAPEIVRGALAGPASDLFSLGSVARRCLSGEPAWPADRLDDVLAQSAVGQWPDVDDRLAPADLCAIVRRLLAPEPADRGSAGRLAVDLRRVGTPEPVGLVRIDDDGVPRGPAASTVLRPDAVRPPVVPRTADRSRHRRLHTVGVPARLPFRAMAIAGVVTVLLAGALATGWWWSGQGTARPVVAGTVAGGTVVASTPAGGDAAAGSAAGSTSGVAAEPTSGVAAEPDWYAVVRGLDAARSAAFVAGDASALDDVYADAAPARAEDERRIAELAAARHYVTAAGHVIRSAALVDRAPTGDAVVEVLESLPAYPVYASNGSLVGYTSPAAAASMLLHLQPTDGGFRIRAVGAADR